MQKYSINYLYDVLKNPQENLLDSNNVDLMNSNMPDFSSENINREMVKNSSTINDNITQLKVVSENFNEHSEIIVDKKNNIAEIF